MKYFFFLFICFALPNLASAQSANFCPELTPNSYSSVQIFVEFDTAVMSKEDVLRAVESTSDFAYHLFRVSYSRHGEKLYVNLNPRLSRESVDEMGEPYFKRTVATIFSKFQNLKGFEKASCILLETPGVTGNN